MRSNKALEILKNTKRMYLIKQLSRKTITYYFRDGRTEKVVIEVVWNKERTSIQSRREIKYETLEDMARLVTKLTNKGYINVED